MLERPINLAIVDAHTLFRKTLKNFLSESQGLTVAIQASDVFDLIEKLKDNPAEILLLDLVTPGLNVIGAINLVRHEYPSIRILVLTTNAEMDMLSDLLDAGVHGLISKSEEPEELLQAIYTVSDNKIYRNRAFTDALYWNKQNNLRGNRSTSLTPLNDREKRILQLIWEEKTNKEIADELYLGIRSVEKIRQDIKEKTGIKSTVGLLKYAINQTIITIKPQSTFRPRQISK